ncbi:sulfotransferase domain-containing protein [Candidatus Entotheonella palauensis]|uniref:sulfotransferase domain-containing protein n=1 Tax=Candidatus Entotheonella palauensis TaxID=93172 RepID=UPI000B7FACA4|nr:sulfotransferase domain-containing protein [Candidatus Entotheonella palauensis]
MSDTSHHSDHLPVTTIAEDRTGCTPKEAPATGHIIWLASYPKSGNTWFRAFLANYLREADHPVDINRLGGGPIASARMMFDDEAGVKASELTVDEIERWRPRVYEQISAACTSPLFMKIHDAYTYNAQGEPLMSKAATQGVLYFVRNPLDVAVSYTHHAAAEIDSIIALMGDSATSMVGHPKRLFNQLRQRLLSWSDHVLSWVDEPGLRVHVMRYEDMQLRPFETFRDAVTFVDLPDDAERIERAIAHASFEVLRGQEVEKAFQEKTFRAESFFRKGKIGSWREVLTREQVERLIADHGDVMRRFGYLTSTGELVY